MAEPADSAEVAASKNNFEEESDEGSGGSAGESGAASSATGVLDDSAMRARRTVVFNQRTALLAVAVIVVALGAMAGWLGYQVHQDRNVAAERDMYVSAARQAVLNLTTIDYTTVDDDVQRVLDSTTGAFHDDFQARATPFVDVVKKAQSKSEGTVSNAAVASTDGETAQVMMTVSVKMSNAGAAEQQPRTWRMSIEVKKTGDAAKVSNVQFVS